MKFGQAPLSCRWHQRPAAQLGAELTAMCGLTGFIADARLDRAQLGPVAQSMAEVILHRAPDYSAVCADAVSGIAHAFRRLADFRLVTRRPSADALG